MEALFISPPYPTGCGDTRRQGRRAESQAQECSCPKGKERREKQSIWRAFFGPLSPEECGTCKTPPIFQQVISVWNSSNEHVHVDAL